jgi:hypothetical protein
VPTEAVFDNSETAAYITFDRDIAPPEAGSWNASTFTLHQAPRWHETGVVSLAAPNRVRITGINPHIVAGSALIDYHAGLGTLVGENGLPVASFTGFPCPPVA